MGTGEVTGYLSTYGSAKVDRAVLIGPIPPFLSQAPDNPEGVPANLFDGFRQSAAADTPAWMKGFLDNFYNMDQFGGNRVSDEAYKAASTWPSRCQRSPRTPRSPPGRPTSGPTCRKSTSLS